MLAALEDGIEWMTSAPNQRSLGPAGSIRETLADYRDELAGSLGTDEYILLDRVVAAIANEMDESESPEAYRNMTYIFPTWIERVRNSPFLWVMGLAEDRHDYLTEGMCRLLQSLGAKVKGKRGKDSNAAAVIGRGGFTLLERHEGGIIIRSSEGHIVACGLLGDAVMSFTEYELVSGYSETFGYAGCVRQGRRNGLGVSFNGDHQAVYEGIWKNGSLARGIVHRCVVGVAGEATGSTGSSDLDELRLDLEYVGQYDDMVEGSGLGIKFALEGASPDNYWIVDMVLRDDTYDILRGTSSPLRIALERDHPWVLERLLKDDDEDDIL